MNRIFLRAFLFIFLLAAQSVILSAQDITGIWRGRFVSEGGEEYRLEFQIKQTNKGLEVNGVSYSYLDVRFYGKATMTGNFNYETQTLGIQEIKTVELKMSSGSTACIMKYNLTFAKSGKEEFLEGSFTSKFEKSNPPFAKRGGDCGGGTVYLRKVPTSDFYIEPFLRDDETVKDTVKTNPPIVKSNPKSNPPVIKSTPRVGNPQKGTTKTGITKKPTVGTTKNNTSNKIDSTKKTTTETQTSKTTSVTTPQALKNRENALAQVITVNTKDVTIKLYDNGDIDGDTISVYVDKRLVLSHKGLSASPIIYKLDFDDSNTEHEVVMVAENLGRIPPNTSLMVINAGDKRYQVQITSTEQKNAMVKFKYVKPSTP
jgi:hypothetical protein